MEFVKFNEPLVEINADRKPRLTGGRRGSSTLLPGGTNVTNNLVPVSQLPPSAGSLANVFDNLNKSFSTSGLENIGKQLTGKGRKCGGATLGQILKNPSEHQAQFDAILKGAKKSKKGGAISIDKSGKVHYSGSDNPNFFNKKSAGAMVMNRDGSVTGVGSDDPNHWSRMPKQGGAYIGTDGKVHTSKKGLGSARGGKMSSLVPSHGHGAQTQIGTNYKLAQFGGSMTQPIGNTASTLSPALSGMSVGAGRRPKGKDLNRLIKYMADTKAKLHGMKSGAGFFDSAYKAIKDVGTDLLNKHGAQIFDKGVDLLKDEMKKRAHEYITGGLMDMEGGSFWGDVWDGIKAIATGIWDALQLILNDDVVKQVERDVLHMGVQMAGDYAKQQMMSGAPAPTGAGIANPILVGKFKKQGGDAIGDFYTGVKPLPPNIDINILKQMLTPAQFQKYMNSLKKQNLLDLTHLTASGMPGADGHGVRKIGGKKPSARGAIVSKIMKEKGLSLPMASKYVKEHGLY